MSIDDRAPGWDAKAISDIVAKHYEGRLADLFEAHGWPERAAAMMPAQGHRIVSIYGSIEAFVSAHEQGREGNPVLNPLATLAGQEPKVLLTSYWGFSPEDWPCLTFTDQGRLRTIMAESHPGFFLRHLWQQYRRGFATRSRSRARDIPAFA